MTHGVFVWFHILLVAWWLGGEWGVFNASTNVANASLSLEERKRHLETAFRIDIVPRTAIVLMLAVGLLLSADFAISPIRGGWLGLIWIATICWATLVLSAFRYRGTAKGLKLTMIDERIRTVVIPVLVVASVVSLATGEPFTARWMALKVGIFGVLLFIGLLLRWTMRAWVVAFRMLATDGSTPHAEHIISSSLARARRYAYVYWILIATNAFLGVNKPF